MVQGKVITGLKIMLLQTLEGFWMVFALCLGQNLNQFGN